MDDDMTFEGPVVLYYILFLYYIVPAPNTTGQHILVPLSGSK